MLKSDLYPGLKFPTWLLGALLAMPSASLAATAAEQSPASIHSSRDELIELSPYVVEEDAKTPWLTTKMDGTEVLSRYASGLTATLINRYQRLISQRQNLQQVYIALGRPDRIVITPDGKTITWTYRSYVQPVTSTNRTIIGRESRSNLANNSPLQDTMDAWNYGVLKQEFPDSPQGDDMSKWEPAIVPKASTQSWAEYDKYRLQIAAVKGSNNAATTNPETLRALKGIAKKAELAYEEAPTIPPISSPDPLKLEVIFVNQLVTDAIVDNSFSAFSAHALNLSGTPTPP